MNVNNKIGNNSVLIGGNNSNIEIKNGAIYINGEKYLRENSENNVKYEPITILIAGDVQTLNIDCCEKIKVNGNVVDLKVTNGDIRILNNVEGNVSNVNGDIEACTIKGSVSTVNGDIIKK